MSKQFTDVDGTTTQLLNEVIKAHHMPFHDHKLNIGIQFVTGEEETPPIKVQGREMFGKVKFTTEDDRADGAPDVRILLDFTKWERASIDEQNAMLDELLYSFEIRMTAGDAPVVITDDAGRPKLKRRRPDLFISGYSDVHKRHGRASCEFSQAKAIVDRFQQLNLFMLPEPSAFEKKAKGQMAMAS